MKRQILALCSAALMIASLASCSTAGTSSTGEEPVGSAPPLEADVSIAEGEKRMTEGLNFGGKEFKLALPYKPTDNVYDRKIAAFNEAFDAKVSINVLNWATFNTELATAQASGSPYDIIFYHSEFYPSTNVAGLLEPLESYFTKKDLYDPAKPEEGGLNAELIESYYWQNKCYGVASTSSVFPEVMYYNKRLFRDAGFEDPLELYQNDQWTWEKLMEMAKEVTDPAEMTYFLGGFGDVSVWLSYNAVSGIVFEDGTPRQNLQDERLIAAMNSYKNIYNGPDAISYNGIDTSEGDLFTEGKVYMYVAVIDAYSGYANAARNNNAFGKNLDNLGIVPLPTISTNPENLYPIHAVQGWAAGAGSSDPRAAVAFALFESTWVDDAPSEDAMPAETRQMFMDRLNEGLFANYCGFQNNDGKTFMALLNYELGKEIREGGDVASVLDKYQNAVQKCIVDSMSKQ